MKSEITIEHLSETFKVLGDKTRIKILFALSIHSFLKSKHKKVLWLIPLAIFISLILTFSRGAWISSFFSLIFLLYFSFKDTEIRKLTLVSLSLIILLLVGLFSIQFNNKKENILKYSAFVNHSDWRNYSLPADNQKILTIKLEDSFTNTTSNQKNFLYISNITNKITMPKRITNTSSRKCGDYCVLYSSVYFLKTKVNKNFSMLMKGKFVGKWPKALISLEEDTLTTRIKNSVLSGRIKTIKEMIAIRQKNWKNAFSKIKEHPFLGNGYTLLKIDKNKMEHSHNLYLQILLERGIFSLLTFFGILFLFFRDAKRYSQLSLAFYSGILALLIHGTMDYVFYSVSAGLLFFIYLALINIEHKKNEKSK